MGDWSDGGGLMAAPFVAKTYRMVDDQATEAVISWGRENNSFVIADAFALSRDLLPAHFKQANFSSSVHQLNTYGLRKVDPDRWEFAHTSFLTGKTHLLRHITRRSSSTREVDEQVEGRVAEEVARPRQEQRWVEEEMRRMGWRLAETERRPGQMLAFMLGMLRDPDLLHRLAARPLGLVGRSGPGCAPDGGAGKGVTGRAEEIDGLSDDDLCVQGAADPFLPAIDPLLL